MLATVSCPLFEAVGKEDTKMNTNQCDIGLIGLAVMGENLALNLESKGFSVAVFNRTTEVTEKFAAGRAKRKKHSADTHDGGICRCTQETAHSHDDDQGRQAGGHCYRRNRAIPRARATC